jgi:hypothetical protein
LRLNDPRLEEVSVSVESEVAGGQMQSRAAR